MSSHDRTETKNNYCSRCCQAVIAGGHRQKPEERDRCGTSCKRCEKYEGRRRGNPQGVGRKGNQVSRYELNGEQRLSLLSSGEVIAPAIRIVSSWPPSHQRIDVGRIGYLVTYAFNSCVRAVPVTAPADAKMQLRIEREQYHHKRYQNAPSPTDLWFLCQSKYRPQ